MGGKSVKKPKSSKLIESGNTAEAFRPKTAASQNGQQPDSQGPAANGEHSKTPVQTKLDFNATSNIPEGDEEDYLTAGEQIWNEKWYPQVKEIIIQSILSAWDKIEWRKGGIGLYGFDLFPDVNGKLWLLEINKCPTMEYSTAVTKKLVPLFLDQLTELIIDKRKGDHPLVGNLERVFNVQKLRDLSEF